MAAPLAKRGKSAPLPAQGAKQYNPTWSLQDKQNFFAGLSRGKPFRLEDGSIAWQELSTLIGNKSVYQVKEFARKIGNLEGGLAYPEFKKMAPIEIWRELSAASAASDTTAEFCFPQVLTVAGLERSNDGTRAADDPDWKGIYSYLTAVTKGVQPDSLGPEESAILLELIDDLTKKLAGSDTRFQRELMHEHYSDTRQLLFQDSDSEKPPVRGSVEPGGVLAAFYQSSVRQAFPSMNPFAIPFEVLEFKDKKSDSKNSLPRHIEASSPKAR